jgi:hypothetical protein
MLTASNDNNNKDARICDLAQRQRDRPAVILVPDGMLMASYFGGWETMV